jgi:cobalamin biosynthesis protein CobD/CbiB
MELKDFINQFHTFLVFLQYMWLPLFFMACLNIYIVLNEIRKLMKMAANCKIPEEREQLREYIGLDDLRKLPELPDEEKSKIIYLLKRKIG